MARYGCQDPTFESVGGWDHTDGPEAAALFAQYGIDLIPSQRRELDLMCARKADGSPQALTIGICKPRQNGKSFAACYYSVWMCAVEGWNVLYTAHNGGTVTKFFKRLCDLFDDPRNEDWHKLLDYVYRQPGREGIYLKSGSCIEFATRTNGARGGSYDMAVIDEAQEYTDEQQNAIKPTLRARGHVPQMVYLGTPVYPTCHGTIFRDMHDGAHSGCTGAWWLEWAIDALPPRNVTEGELLELAYMTNPMMGRLILEETVIDEIRTIDAGGMTREGFAREILGWWMSTDGGYEHAIGATAWESCEVDESPDPKAAGVKVAYGVKFAPDGTHAAVAVAVRSKDAPLHVELVSVRDTTHGTGWVSDMLAPMVGDACCYLADGSGSADNLERDLRERGLPKLYCRTAKTRDVIQADQRMADLVASGGMSHIGQPELTASAVGAAKRHIGGKASGAMGFGDAPGVDSAPVEAAALAMQAVMTTLRDPHKVQRVVSF